jgi:hypothetical protein
MTVGQSMKTIASSTAMPMTCVAIACGESRPLSKMRFRLSCAADAAPT